MKQSRDEPISVELRKRGIHLSRRLGQNFMVDRNMLDFLVRQARLESDDLVLEVGAGAGFLTERLAASAGTVVAVEVDSRLCDVAAGRLGGFGNVTLIDGDALSRGRSWSQPVRRAVLDALEARPGRALKLVANLPYNIVTAVVSRVLVGDVWFDGCWFTGQREVAGRLTAKPGSRNYGYISVVTALFGDARVVRVLPPTVFWPQPKVESAIVELVPSREKAALAGDAGLLAEGVSRILRYRRRQVSGVLKALGLDQSDILKLDKLFLEMGVGRRERVFKLPPEVIREIARAVVE